MTGVGRLAHQRRRADRARLQHRVQDAGAGGLVLRRRSGFRTSDHDPVLIGVGLAPPPTASAGGPYTVPEGGSTTLAGSGIGQDLTYEWDLDNDGTFETAGQTATFSAATIDGPATRQVRFRVSDGELSAVSSATVQVANVAPTATFTATPSVFAGSPIALALDEPD